MVRHSYPLVALLALASPALAHHCTEPYAPDVRITATTPKQDVAQLHDDVQSFIEASDKYQQCLVDAAKTDAGVRVKLETLLETNQHDKQRVADVFNAALRSYNPGQVAATKLSDAKN